MECGWLAARISERVQRYTAAVLGERTSHSKCASAPPPQTPILCA
jgi:hypothetical protein